MRDRLRVALQDALKNNEEERLSIIRLINAAIKDRDIAVRADGKADGVSDAEF